MARSRRARRTLNSVEQLVEALPERFLAIDIGENPVETLTAYMAELSEWIRDQGVRPESVQQTTVEAMEAIGASPADWYLRAASKRGT